jgi:hypothetical protein
MQWKHSSAVRAIKCKSLSACWKAVASVFCAAGEMHYDAAPHIYNRHKELLLSCCSELKENPVYSVNPTHCIIIFGTM